MEENYGALHVIGALRIISSATACMAQWIRMRIRRGGGWKNANSNIILSIWVDYYIKFKVCDMIQAHIELFFYSFIQIFFWVKLSLIFN